MSLFEVISSFHENNANKCLLDLILKLLRTLYFRFRSSSKSVRNSIANFNEIQFKRTTLLVFTASFLNFFSFVLLLSFHSGCSAILAQLHFPAVSCSSTVVAVLPVVRVLFENYWPLKYATNSQQVEANNERNDDRGCGEEE